VAESAVKLGSTGLGVNPALQKGAGGGIAGLFDRGQIGFLPGIDYANPDLSHFHSRHFWETGLVTDRDATGWLGRWLDVKGTADNPLQGISMTGSLSPVLRPGRAPVAAVDGPDDAQLWMRNVWGDPYDQAMTAWREIANAPRQGNTPQAAGTAARLMADVASRLKPYAKAGDDAPDPLAGPVAYPAENRLGDRLKVLAGLLAQPLGIRLAAVDADGDFDTHDRQGEDLTKSLKLTSEALSAFQADLESRGIADRVLTLVWSEFGRRAAENGSGTDHGAAGVGFVMGSRAAGRMIGEFPGLDRLDDHGNLRATADFRGVYASLAADWFGVDPSSILPDLGGIARPAVIR
jgi:uncharacterized protein (DUF1501 family)